MQPQLARNDHAPSFDVLVLATKLPLNDRSSSGPLARRRASGARTFSRQSVTRFDAGRGFLNIGLREDCFLSTSQRPKTSSFLSYGRPVERQVECADGGTRASKE